LGHPGIDDIPHPEVPATPVQPTGIVIMSNGQDRTRSIPSHRAGATPPLSAAEPPVGPAAEPAVEPVSEPLAEPVAEPTARPPVKGVPHTRTGAAWFGICAAALLTVVLIVFMLQNTRSVRVDFLWMDGTLPLALALLIAAVGSALLAMVVGAARITQLRRLNRRQRH